MAGLIVLATACSAGPSLPAVSPTPSPSPVASVSVPSGGVTLAELGFRNGPSGFSVPRSATYATAVDQPNLVTLVLNYPAPAEVSTYLRANLPAAGFEITASAAGEQTFTFVGDGWAGTFTTSGSQSAIVLNAR